MYSFDAMHIHRLVYDFLKTHFFVAMLNYEKALPIDYIDRFLELHTVYRHRMEAIPAEDLAVVACQMISVCAIPVELEQ